MASHRGAPGARFLRDFKALGLPGVRAISSRPPSSGTLSPRTGRNGGAGARLPLPCLSRPRRPVAGARPLEGASLAATLSQQIGLKFTSHRGTPVMDDTPCCRFFLEPSCAPQRQYEALRAAFIDRGRQKDVAE